jgi:hypothetical protein
VRARLGKQGRQGDKGEKQTRIKIKPIYSQSDRSLRKSFEEMILQFTPENENALLYKGRAFHKGKFFTLSLEQD